MTDITPSDDVPDNHEVPVAASEFEQLPDLQQMSLPAEFWLFIKEEKKWWLTPIILVLLGVGALVALTSTGAAPFIYTLF
ncbi:MAG: DUF5989 family protein [Fuerstiella sp.]|jgi:hypothetical protein|nr:DUF5989 family protein [Fuerstiella sp.]